MGEIGCESCGRQELGRSGKGSPLRTPLGTRGAPTTPPEKNVFLLKQAETGAIET